jgi:hypothetical protein
MQKALIKKGGYIKRPREMADAHPVALLGLGIELAPDFTLCDYTLILEKEPVFRHISAFDAGRALQGNSFGCAPEGIDRLEFSKSVEMTGFPGKPGLYINSRLCGMGPQGEVSLRHLPLASLMQVPLTLGLLNHVIFGDCMETMKFETVYTLFEFLDGMAWELSFLTAPEQCTIRR